MQTGYFMVGKLPALHVTMYAPRLCNGVVDHGQVNSKIVIFAPEKIGLLFVSY
jgi:hypothetical protein